MTIIAAASGNGSVPAEVEPLFRPYKLGRFELAHRMVYPPLTRSRAIGTIPQPYMGEYYAQRATKGGLIISEGTVISDTGHGYVHTPGLYTAEQVEAWKPVVKAVKDKGAIFFTQLWHCGRASHPEFQPNNARPLAPSAVGIGPDWPCYTYTGQKQYVVPQALDKAGIKLLVEQFAQAAKNAIEAGFDGVEIHGANGYIIDEFLKDSDNKRTDEYGGPIENRCRFALEVVEAVTAAIGADRVGLRISPFTGFLDTADSKPYSLHTYLAEELRSRFPDLAYLHMVEPRILGNSTKEYTPDSLAPFRIAYQGGTFIAAGAFKRETGAEAVRSGEADLVAYGRLWIANPDLPKRFLLDAPLNAYDRNTFYSQGMEGYLDYPFLEDEKKVVSA